jgi:hypothetical protein
LKHLANKVAAFLKAEEVPRWFGLSLMLIYLIGLATVANVGIQQARQESARTFRESTQYALELLADDLARSYAAVTDEPNRRLVFQRALHDFAAHTPVQMLRVVDRNDVMYSLDPDEVGTASTFSKKPDDTRRHQRSLRIAGAPQALGSTSNRSFASPSSPWMRHPRRKSISATPR